MVDALIIDACRTPRGIGKAGKGALSGIHPQQLGAAVLRALADRTGINTADVDDIVWGTSSQRGQQSGDLGRMSALDAGYDVRASGVTLDRFCGSGITSVNMAANSIMSGSEDLVIAGGTDRQSPAARPPPAIAPGRLRRCGRNPRGHFAAGCRRTGAGEPEAGGCRHQGRLFQQEPCSGSSRGRPSGPRPRRISAAADHDRRACGFEAGLHRGGGLCARRQGHHLPQAHPG